jgi:hypothetical protein
MSVQEAADYARKTPATVRLWCHQFGLGRTIGQRGIQVSRVAFPMFLADDGRALTKYLRADRTSPEVVRYFVQLGLAHLLPKEVKNPSR